jgi:hypothetical protein
VMAAARRGVEHLRRVQGAERGAGHLPPGILVSVSLVPQILAKASREAAETHLSSCADCTDQARSVRDAAAGIDQDPEETTAQHHIGKAMGGTRQVAALSPVDPFALPSRQDNVQAADAMLQRLLETADAVEAAREAGPGSPRRRRRRRGPRERKLSPFPLALFGVALLLVVSRMDFRCRPQSLQAPVDPTISALAEFTLPALPKPGDWPAGSEPGFQELLVEDCKMAANRFRLARYRDSGVLELWYWEGLASGCAGDGERAVEAFVHLQEHDNELPDVDWYLSQAALLAGRRELAEQSLRAVCGGTSHRLNTACAQLARLGTRSRD